ncbi:flippase [Polynucleobacter sp. HIN9]|uniref:oligosaccharide flippase family protein n=1 Tax=Polynucleobacter sp. HIN9 TaxID=3047868 RepID=UPI0025724786|nr:oligosaccharide flippase family protein [Polynucleobacter sp. HIN9]BEI40366.1 flippase [Polynucleobacter sp. HIN9]
MKNYLYQLTSAISVGVISFGLSILIARQIGTTNFGLYSIALAVGSILAIFIDGGFRNLLTRERTKSTHDLSYLNQTLPSIAMGHSLIVALLASILCFLLFSSHLYLGLSIIWCFWAVILTQFACAILRGDGHLKVEAFWQIKQRICTALFIAAAIFIGFFEAWQLLLAWFIGALTINLIFREGFLPKPAFKPLLFEKLKLYRTLLPLLWIDLATTIYFRSDLIMLSIFKVSDADIGRYASAYRLIEASVLISSPLSIIFFRKVRLLFNDQITRNRYVFHSTLLALGLGLLGVVLTNLLSNQLINLFYGEEYATASKLLIILSWMILLLIPNIVLTQTALALNLDKYYALTATIAAIVNVVFNLLFIPLYGIVASAYSSIITELVLFMGLSFSIWKNRKSTI